MNLNLNDEQLKTVISAAILQTLSEERRGELLTEALKHLLTPERKGYGQPEISPLQSAFNYQLTCVARDIAGEMLREPEVQARLRSLIVEAVEAAFSTNRQRVIERVSDAVADVLAGKDR